MEGDNDNLSMWRGTRELQLPEVFAAECPRGFVVNTASMSYMHSLSITKKVCPEARQGHPLLDKT